MGEFDKNQQDQDQGKPEGDKPAFGKLDGDKEQQGNKDEGGYGGKLQGKTPQTDKL